MSKRSKLRPSLSHHVNSESARELSIAHPAATDVVTDEQHNLHVTINDLRGYPRQLISLGYMFVFSLSLLSLSTSPSYSFSTFDSCLYFTFAVEQSIAHHGKPRIPAGRTILKKRTRTVRASRDGAAYWYET